jgi:3-deoxy-D-manno-octulosonic-acid transferase
MRWWLLRSGVFPRSHNRTLCVHGSAPADFAAAAALLADLRAAFPRLALRLISPRQDTVRWLQTRYPEEVVLPTPWGVRYFVRRFRRNTHPGALIVLRSLDEVPRSLLAGFERRKVAVTLVDGEPTPALTNRCHSLARICMRSQKDAKRLLDAALDRHTGEVEIIGDVLRERIGFN